MFNVSKRTEEVCGGVRIGPSADWRDAQECPWFGNPWSVAQGGGFSSSETHNVFLERQDLLVAQGFVAGHVGAREAEFDDAGNPEGEVWRFR